MNNIDFFFFFILSLIYVTENWFCLSQKETNTLLLNITDLSDAGISVKLVLRNDSRHNGFKIMNYHLTTSLINHSICLVMCVLPHQHWMTQNLDSEVLVTRSINSNI